MDGKSRARSQMEGYESVAKSKKETNSSKVDELASPGIDLTGRAHLLSPRFH